ncbi:MAG: MarR family winged helix-turn-helix transcriptional regulator [Jatrophihabitans sp.]|uniref:MarR family winged helix-turn-helix transcriptional regulator n=1 Tax=Jatrophihabitans sp. TaxID=1932789 RepID=UPI003F8185B8
MTIVSEPVDVSTRNDAAPPLRDGVRRVADDVVALVQAFAKLKQQFMAAAAHDVEWSSRMVLRALDREGPLRAGALAERMEADPSTISRQVAALVRDGLVERRADPDDGRASLLVLTPKATEVLVEHEELRKQHFGRLVADWSDEELQTFADLLERFTHDFTAHRHEWIPTRTGTPSASTEGAD